MAVAIRIMASLVTNLHNVCRRSLDKMLERYSLSSMKELWTLRAQYEKWLEVELAVVWAMEQTGDVPAGTYSSMESVAEIDVSAILKLEENLKHDLLAFIRFIEDQSGDVGRHFHRGLTSSDVKDTALAVQLRESMQLILDEARKLRKALLVQAKKYVDLVIVGRTHGMHAEPTTLGLKFYVWYDQLSRDINRLANATESVSVGKLSGPVGTYSRISPHVEKLACERLGLEPSRVSTQVIQRDRHAHLMTAIATAGATLEQIALEIRHLSRTEVAEVEEPRPEGSSSMPHKRNPITSERICGLARILRGNAQVALENVAMWHERDISHSSAERIILPDSLTLLHYMFTKTTGIIKELVVHSEQIQTNLTRTQGCIFSQIILLELVESGMSRTIAHELVKDASTKALCGEESLLSAINSDPRLGDNKVDIRLDEAALLKRLRSTSRRIINQRE